jgi:hypothetical protein
MQKVRWVGIGCAVLFAIPLCVAGTTLIFSAPRSTGRDLLVRIGSGSVFLLFGLVLVGVAVFATHDRRSNLPPTSIRDGGSFNVAALWTFALLWNLITLPALFAFEARGIREPLVAFMFLFPILGIVLLIVATYLTMRRVKYGASICHIERVPIVLGRDFHGEIETHLRDSPPNGFVLTLSRVQQTSTGRSTEESALWSVEQKVAMTAPSAAGVHVPFTFRVPIEAGSAEIREGSFEAWILKATAEVTGIDYSATFDLPLSGVAPAPAEPDARWPAPHADPGAWIPESRANIRTTLTPSGGEELRIGPARGAAGWVFLCFDIAWFGFIALMVRMGAPIAMPILFGLFGVFFVFVALDFFLGRTIVRADHNGVSVQRTWLGLGRPRMMPAAEVRDVVITSGLTQPGGTPYYAVEVRGTWVASVKYLQDKRDAEMVATRIRHALGRRLASATPAGTPAAARS